MTEMRLQEKLHAALEQQLGDYITGTIIKRGWQYYLSGYVQNVQVTTHDTLTAVVRGSDVYAVIVDAGHFRYSNCTCPYDGFCKHMAAVFFQYISEREGGREQAEQAYFRLLGLAPASAFMKPGDETEPIANVGGHPGTEDTVQEWLAWMDKEHGEVWRKCRHSLHALQPVLSSLKGLARDWPKPQQRLHWMTAIVFVLEQAERAIATVDTFSRYYHELSFARMAEPWIEHLYSLSSELKPEAMNEGELEWANTLIGHVKNRALLNERQLFEWAPIYITLCEKLSAIRSWYENELADIQRSLSSKAGTDGNESFLQTVAGMMFFFDNDDVAAIDHFAKSSFERSQKMMYPCAEKRIREKDWGNVQLWLSFLFEQVRHARTAGAIGPFMTLCMQADQERPDLEVWTMYMTELLPYSYAALSEHWISMKRYDDWADLQLLIGTRAEELNPNELREVAKFNPYALMPIFHHAIEASIQSRNRQGYRIAVKQLKKLERLYSTAKDTERWDAYIARLADKYQRLRAFQEELWKGKLVT